MARLLRRYDSPIYGNYRRYSLIYGAITGALLGVYATACWLLRDAISAPETFGTDIVMALCIFGASYIYREKVADGKIYLKELLLLGMGIGIIAGVVYFGMLLIYGEVIDAEFCSRCIEARVSDMDPEMENYQQALEATQKYTNSDWAFIGGFRSAVMSIIITFFSAIIFRTEQSVRRTK